MAYSTLPEPGTRLGPCLDACKHKDCALNRADAARICWCGEIIGYGVRYMKDEERGPDALQHADCAFIRAEAR
jgi:hypothetical protein